MLILHKICKTRLFLGNRMVFGVEQAVIQQAVEAALDASKSQETPTAETIAQDAKDRLAKLANKDTPAAELKAAQDSINANLETITAFLACVTARAALKLAYASANGPKVSLEEAEAAISTQTPNLNKLKGNTRFAAETIIKDWDNLSKDFPKIREVSTKMAAVELPKLADNADEAARKSYCKALFNDLGKLQLIFTDAYEATGPGTFKLYEEFKEAVNKRLSELGKPENKGQLSADENESVGNMQFVLTNSDAALKGGNDQGGRMEGAEASVNAAFAEQEARGVWNQLNFNKQDARNSWRTDDFTQQATGAGGWKNEEMRNLYNGAVLSFQNGMKSFREAKGTGNWAAATENFNKARDAWQQLLAIQEGEKAKNEAEPACRDAYKKYSDLYNVFILRPGAGPMLGGEYVKLSAAPDYSNLDGEAMTNLTTDLNTATERLNNLSQYVDAVRNEYGKFLVDAASSYNSGDASVKDNAQNLSNFVFRYMNDTAHLNQVSVQCPNLNGAAPTLELLAGRKFSLSFNTTHRDDKHYDLSATFQGGEADVVATPK